MDARVDWKSRPLGCVKLSPVLSTPSSISAKRATNIRPVFDSLDKLEPLILAALCADRGYASLKVPAFGKGWVEADKWWLDFLRGSSGCAAAAA